MADNEGILLKQYRKETGNTEFVVEFIEYRNWLEDKLLEVISKEWKCSNDICYCKMNPEETQETAKECEFFNHK